MGERQSDSRSEGIVLADEAQSSTADAPHNFNPAQGTVIRAESLN